jgi:hypothetical protein
VPGRRPFHGIAVQTTHDHAVLEDRGARALGQLWLKSIPRRRFLMAAWRLGWILSCWHSLLDDNPPDTEDSPVDDLLGRLRKRGHGAVITLKHGRGCASSATGLRVPQIGGRTHYGCLLDRGVLLTAVSRVVD